MERNRNRHDYRKLDPARKEIRLLELVPGDRAEKVRVRLLYASLDAEPRYDALSYMWGDPEGTRSIQLDDNVDFQVTVNLENALRDLRLSDRSSMLWVDAVCINQGDIEERNHQVLLMHTIYERASVVRAWLDIEIDPGCPAFARLARLDENSSADELGNDSGFWEPVTEISKNAYWQRVWIQQEITYAKDLIIHCRRDVVLSNSFRHYRRLMQTTTFRGHTVFDMNFKVLPHVLDHQYPHNDDGLLVRHYSSIYRFYDSLVEALSHSQTLEATDPRDKVYALVSLVKGYNEGDIDINYGLPVAQVYRNVVELALRKPHPLNFLADATLCNQNPAYGLPTWLPDWSFILKDPKVMSMDTSIEQAATAIVADPPAMLERGSVLSVCGFRLGHILRLSVEKDMDQDASAMIERLREWEDFVNTATEICLTTRSGSSQAWTRRLFRSGKAKRAERSANFRALLRTILFVVDGMQQEGRKALVSQLETVVCDALAKWDNGFSTALLWEEPNLTYWKSLVSAWLLAARSQRLFMTNGALFGLASKAVLPGDDVWILHHCPKAMVLRRVNDHYLVVGPARLDSNKLGELTQEWVRAAGKDGRSGNDKIERILLR